MHPDIKRRICHYITDSTYFSDILNEKRVYMHQMYHRLRDTNRNIFLNLYQSSSRSTFGDTMVYANPTRMVTVEIEPNTEILFEEYIFACLTLNLADVLSVYFISEEYNVSDTPESSYMAGRFIFLGFFGDSKVSGPFAIAEEPAISLCNPGADVERSYLENRWGNTISEFSNDSDT